MGRTAHLSTDGVRAYKRSGSSEKLKDITSDVCVFSTLDYKINLDLLVRESVLRIMNVQIAVLQI